MSIITIVLTGLVMASIAGCTIGWQVAYSTCLKQLISLTSRSFVTNWSSRIIYLSDAGSMEIVYLRLFQQQ